MSDYLLKRRAIKATGEKLPDAPKPAKPLAPKSEKQLSLEKQYLKQLKVWMKKHPFCKAKLKQVGCGGATEDCHHSRGRGEYLLDESTWVPVCRKCHTWIEAHPEEAKALGLSESRLKITVHDHVNEQPIKISDKL